MLTACGLEVGYFLSSAYFITDLNSMFPMSLMVPLLQSTVFRADRTRREVGGLNPELRDPGWGCW